MQTKAAEPLSIVVVGGGIGGLAASALLAQSGHRVVVLERRDAAFERRSTGGISMTHNSVRIVQNMGLQDELVDIADTGAVTAIRYNDGEVIQKTRKDFPHFMVHRADLLRILFDHAVRAGVDVQFQVSIASIHESQEDVTVKLEDGTEMTVDLVVGADGIDSIVRRVIFPQVSPQVTPATVMLVSIPGSVMEAQPETAKLYSEGPFKHFLGPGRSIVAWTITKRQIYHLQFCDYEYGDGKLYSLHDPPEAPYITELHDTSGLIRRWSDFEPRIQHIVKSADSFTKWKIAELPPLPSYSSKHGRMILLGDAAHAIQPFAGQGANMAIEDAQTLATLLGSVLSSSGITNAVSVYNKLRVPRLAEIREIIEANIREFGLKDGEEQKKRDQLLASRGVGMPQQDSAGAGGQGWKEYTSKERFVWIEDYDAEAEARRAWQESWASKDGGNQGNRANGSV